MGPSINLRTVPAPTELLAWGMFCRLDGRVADPFDNVQVSQGDQCYLTGRVGHVAATDEVHDAEGLPQPPQVC